MSAVRGRNAFHLLTIGLEISATLTVLAGGAYALFLKAVFEPTSADLYGARVGSHLLPLVALAAGVLVLGVAASRPALLGPNARALAAAAAAVSIGLAGVAEVHAYRQLHLSFAAERAAIADFNVPPRVTSQSTTTEVTATPSINRIWDVAAPPATVCAAAQAALAAWADAGTVQAATRPTPSCSFVADKGTDHVQLFGSFLPNDNHVILSLTLTRQH